MTAPPLELNIRDVLIAGVAAVYGSAVVVSGAAPLRRDDCCGELVCDGDHLWIVDAPDRQETAT